MKKIIRLKENDLIKIINKSLIEEQFFRNLITKAAKGAADDAAKASIKATRQGTTSGILQRLIKNVPQLEKRFSKETVNELSRFLDNSLIEGETVFRNNAGDAFIYSDSGKMIPMKQLQEYLTFAAEKGDVISLSNTLPRKLSGNPPVPFREDIIEILSKDSRKAGQSAAKGLSQFETKHLLRNCFSHTYCDVKPILSDFMRKLSGSAKLRQFNPSKVKVMERTNLYGREVIDVSLEDGSRVLFYKSTGSNVATTGKQVGEWFVIPGFAENGWFFKTQDTIDLTKGGNKYLTEMAKFLEKNGSSTLGR